MRASRTLPAGYVHGGTVRWAGNRRLWWWLNLVAVPWAVVSAVGVGAAASALRPEGWVFHSGTLAGFLVALIAGVPAALVLTVLLHEALHGAVMWLVTGSRPRFGFKGWYVYADVPGWFLTRGQMIAVLATPLVVLPAVGLPLTAVLGPVGSLFVTLGLIVNNLAAVGDLYSIWIAVRVRGPVLFGDAPEAGPGEAGGWFVPAEAPA